MTTRRDFLVTGGAALGALAIGPSALRALPGFKPLPALYTDAATRAGPDVTNLMGGTLDADTVMKSEYMISATAGPPVSAMPP